MNTITIIVWLFSVGYFFYFANRFWGSQGYDWVVVGTIVYFFGILLISGLLDIGILYDIYGFDLFGPTTNEPYIPPQSLLYASWGWVQLVLIMLFAIFIPRLFGKRAFYTPIYPSNNEKTFNTIAQVIGLVASTLGIISFYLDHMR